jgi:hypothetical protein
MRVNNSFILRKIVQERAEPRAHQNGPDPEAFPDQAAAVSPVDSRARLQLNLLFSTQRTA